MKAKTIIVSACLVLGALSLMLDYWATTGISLGATGWLGYLYVILIHLMPVLIYPLLYHRVARFHLRLMLCLVPTTCWWVTELIMRMRWHSIAEALWLVISPMALLQLTLILILLGLTHAATTLFHRNKLRLLPSLGFTAVVLAAAASVPASFSIFFTGYQSIFQSNLLPKPSNQPGRLDPDSVISTKQNLPNIVFVLSDDHRYDFTGYAGHPFIETPSIDKLAQQGVVFNRAYVSTSLCSPSRASFLTGVSPYQHGVWNNFTPWSEENRTFFEYLKAAGYSTAFIGKWHMPGNKLPEIAGLDHFISFTHVGGQGVYEWNPMIVNGVETPSRTRYIATELTDYATEWIEDQNSPFVLYLSHKSVHANFQPDNEDIDRYANKDANIPDEAHLWSTHTKNQYVHLTRTPLDQSIRRYGEAIHSLDREIGRLLDYLESKGLQDETIIIYTSDNGYQWGEHELTDKRWAYETSIRIPFVMKLPDGSHAGTRNEKLIANVDVAATFLDAAGLTLPDYMEGMSLLKLLGEPESGWRDSFFYSYFFEPPYPTPTSFALVTDQFKLIDTDWQGYELYDLANDPREMNNLADDPQYATTLADLSARLKRARRENNKVTEP